MTANQPETTRHGLVEGLAHADYRADPSISKSTLDWTALSPSLVAWEAHAPVDDEADTAVDLGTAFETALLEPLNYSAQYIVDTEQPKNTKAGKDEAAEIAETAEANGMTVLPPKTARQIRLMVESTFAHPMARRILSADRMIQPSYFVTDVETGLPIKSRPDIALANVPMLVDVKTTAQLDRFAASVHDLRYHVQDAYYSDQWSTYYAGNAPTFLFLVVSSSRSANKYPVRLFELTAPDREVGRRAYKRDLREYAARLDSGNWTDVETLTRPGWAWRQDEMEDD